ncbi:hypothetical protein NUACC26_013240 [Scytonema sp. NUACC26]
MTHRLTCDRILCERQSQARFAKSDTHNIPLDNQERTLDLM